MPSELRRGELMRCLKKEIVKNSAEQFPHQLRRIHLQLCGELVLEKWNQQEVQLAVFAEVLDVRVAKADGLALGDGNKRDLGAVGER